MRTSGKVVPSMEEIAIVIVCLIFNALLSGSEMAFVTAEKPQLRGLARKGDGRAKHVLSLRERPERTLSVIQVGITLVGAIAAAVGGAGAEESINPLLRQRFGLSENAAEFIAVLIVVLPITYFSVVVGELLPKALALRNPIRIALKSARWLALFERTLSPVVTVLEWSTRKLLLLFFKKPVIEPGLATPETVELDQLSQQTRQYVINLVTVEKKAVRDIFLPWQDAVCADVKNSAEEVEAIVISSRHTRLPVLKDDAVIGILNTKEFVAFRKSGGQNWQDIIRNVVAVQESDPLLRALRQMQEKRSHLSVVLSGNKRIGIVTMEDILEEVIGDVFDEDDDGALRKILSAGVVSRRLGSGQK